MAGQEIKVCRLKASSILEVVVAMVIILVVFGIALTIFSNVIRWSLPYRKVKAELLLRDLQQAPFTASAPEETSGRVDGLKVIRTVVPYEPDPGLSVLTLSALDENNQKIAELQEIIATPE